jgi:hypothetical protein
MAFHWPDDRCQFITEANMTTTGDLRIVVPEFVTWSISNGEVLLFHRDKEEICGLDEVAADAFVRLVADQRLSQVVAELRMIYAVDEAVLLRDLSALLESLLGRGLVEIRA